MKFSKTALRLLLLALIFLLAGCSDKEVPEGTLVSILYSNDVRGKLEGCGCQHNGGGITRRSAALAAAREDDPSIVYCDAGNFLSGTPEVDSTQGLLMVEVYNHLRATVVNVSERELAYGIDAFREARRRADFSFVSANLRHRDASITDPYVIRRMREARVAFIGLCGTKSVMRYDSLKLPEGVTIEEPVVAARKAVSELAGKANLIVLLSTCGDDVDSALARSIPGIHLIIGGRSYRANTNAPWNVGGTRIVRAQRDGRALGRMDMVFGVVPPFEIGEKITVEQGPYRGSAAEVRRISPDKPVVKVTVFMTERKQELVLEYPMVHGIKTFRSTEIPLESAGPSDPEMLALVQERVPGFMDNPAEGARIVR